MDEAAFKQASLAALSSPSLQPSPTTSTLEFQKNKDSIFSRLCFDYPLVGVDDVEEVMRVESSEAEVQPCTADCDCANLGRLTIVAVAALVRLLDHSSTTTQHTHTHITRCLRTAVAVPLLRAAASPSPTLPASWTHHWHHPHAIALATSLGYLDEIAEVPLLHLRERTDDEAAVKGEGDGDAGEGGGTLADDLDEDEAYEDFDVSDDDDFSDFAPVSVRLQPELSVETKLAIFAHLVCRYELLGRDGAIPPAKEATSDDRQEQANDSSSSSSSSSSSNPFGPVSDGWRDSHLGRLCMAVVTTAGSPPAVANACVGLLAARIADRPSLATTLLPTLVTAAAQRDGGACLLVLLSELLSNPSAPPPSNLTALLLPHVPLLHSLTSSILNQPTAHALHTNWTTLVNTLLEMIRASPTVPGAWERLQEWVAEYVRFVVAGAQGGGVVLRLGEGGEVLLEAARAMPGWTLWPWTIDGYATVVGSPAGPVRQTCAAWWIVYTCWTGTADEAVEQDLAAAVDGWPQSASLVRSIMTGLVANGRAASKAGLPERAGTTRVPPTASLTFPLAHSYSLSPGVVATLTALRTTVIAEAREAALSDAGSAAESADSSSALVEAERGSLPPPGVSATVGGSEDQLAEKLKEIRPEILASLKEILGGGRGGTKKAE